MMLANRLILVFASVALLAQAEQAELPRKDEIPSVASSQSSRFDRDENAVLTNREGRMALHPEAASSKAKREQALKNILAARRRQLLASRGAEPRKSLRRGLDVSVDTADMLEAQETRHGVYVTVPIAEQISDTTKNAEESSQRSKETPTTASYVNPEKIKTVSEKMDDSTRNSLLARNSEERISLPGNEGKNASLIRMQKIFENENRRKNTVAMPESLYNHFRPVESNIPIEDMTQFLYFGQKLHLDGINSTSRNNSLEGTSTSSSVASSRRRNSVRRLSTTSPVPRLEEIMNEEMNIALERSTIERNKIPRSKSVFRSPGSGAYFRQSPSIAEAETPRNSSEKQRESPRDPSAHAQRDQVAVSDGSDFRSDPIAVAASAHRARNITHSDNHSTQLREKGTKRENDREGAKRANNNQRQSNSFDAEKSTISDDKMQITPTSRNELFDKITTWQSVHSARDSTTFSASLESDNGMSLSTIDDLASSPEISSVPPTTTNLMALTSLRIVVTEPASYLENISKEETRGKERTRPKEERNEKTEDREFSGSSSEKSAKSEQQLGKTETDENLPVSRIPAVESQKTGRTEYRQHAYAYEITNVTRLLRNYTGPGLNVERGEGNLRQRDGEERDGEDEEKGPGGEEVAATPTLTRSNAGSIQPEIRNGSAEPTPPRHPLPLLLLLLPTPRRETNDRARGAEPARTAGQLSAGTDLGEATTSALDIFTERDEDRGINREVTSYQDFEHSNNTEYLGVSEISTIPDRNSNFTKIDEENVKEFTNRSLDDSREIDEKFVKEFINLTLTDSSKIDEADFTTRSTRLDEGILESSKSSPVHVSTDSSEIDKKIEHNSDSSLLQNSTTDSPIKVEKIIKDSKIFHTNESSTNLPKTDEKIVRNLQTSVTNDSPTSYKVENISTKESKRRRLPSLSFSSNRRVKTSRIVNEEKISVSRSMEDRASLTRENARDEKTPKNGSDVVSMTGTNTDFKTEMEKNLELGTTVVPPSTLDSPLKVRADSVADAKVREALVPSTTHDPSSRMNSVKTEKTTTRAAPIFPVTPKMKEEPKQESQASVKKSSNETGSDPDRPFGLAQDLDPSEIQKMYRSQTSPKPETTMIPFDEKSMEGAGTDEEFLRSQNSSIARSPEVRGRNLADKTKDKDDILPIMELYNTSTIFNNNGTDFTVDSVRPILHENKNETNSTRTNDKKDRVPDTRRNPSSHETHNSTYFNRTRYPPSYHQTTEFIGYRPEFNSSFFEPGMISVSPRESINLSEVITKRHDGDAIASQETVAVVSYILATLVVFPIAVGVGLILRRLIIRNRKVLEESDTSSEISCRKDALNLENGDFKSSIEKAITKLPRIQHLCHEAEKPPPPASQESRWEFPRDKLRLQTVLGQGNFGQVWKAEADDLTGHQGTTRLVAVKTVKEGASPREKEDLIRELEIMQQLGNHPNVVTLLGCCTEEEPHYLILEYVMYGKLLAYLRDHRTRQDFYNFSEDSAALTSRDLTVFGYCVARGMEYLASKKIIHRDLAARNVLVDHNKLCKIADFGMSRFANEEGEIIEARHGRNALPIRWMAPESLIYSLFTTKTDVWSFGILMWEIVTLGSTPYPDMAAREVMRNVQNGYRLERPSHCRSELFRVISRCWHADPDRRPEFQILRRDMAQLLEDGMNGHYVDLESFASECTD